MTQSGVSQHLRKLEDQLGAKLLIRQGKRFSLSDSGEKLYAEAKDILLALSNLEKKVTENPPFEGTARIISPGSVGLKLYPHMLALQSKHPKLVIDYRFAPNSDVEKAIVESTVDIGFMTSKSTLKEVSCTPIAEEPLLLVTPATIEEPDWKTLITLGFIDHPDGSHHADLLLSANYPEFQHSNLFRRRGYSNQIGMILEPVSLGLGFTVLPAHAVEAFKKPEYIKTHRLSNPVSETLYLSVARHRVLQKRIETVIDEAMRWL
ncbi:LysR family transcriptional regulator [Arenicella chitinivorans]|uniref:LysR family transcriptional regulator n=2 Tax=Arenicella chitinivorans TaxID=1329800 RepID=A0A918S2J1_9GAMM|nr:LysR family transcriptional regulator [Arenicella chitinivorans]